jgi:hypothetical protein
MMQQAHHLTLEQALAMARAHGSDASIQRKWHNRKAFHTASLFTVPALLLAGFLGAAIALATHSLSPDASKLAGYLLGLAPLIAVGSVFAGHVWDNAWQYAPVGADYVSSSSFRCLVGESSDAKQFYNTIASEGRPLYWFHDALMSALYCRDRDLGVLPSQVGPMPR